MADELHELSGELLLREVDIHRLTPVGLLIGRWTQRPTERSGFWKNGFRKDAADSLDWDCSTLGGVLHLWASFRCFWCLLWIQGEKLRELRSDFITPLQPQQHSRQAGDLLGWRTEHLTNFCQVASRLLAFSRKAFEHTNWIASWHLELSLARKTYPNEEKSRQSAPFCKLSAAQVWRDTHFIWLQDSLAEAESPVAGVWISSFRGLWWWDPALWRNGKDLQWSSPAVLDVQTMIGLSARAE